MLAYGMGIDVKLLEEDAGPRLRKSLKSVAMRPISGLEGPSEGSFKLDEVRDFELFIMKIFRQGRGRETTRLETEANAVLTSWLN